jgi:very-short-patch-repair endonuclease
VDRARDNEALNHGWRPYRFTWTQITKQPAEVCDTVRHALTVAV